MAERSERMGRPSKAVIDALPTMSEAEHKEAKQWTDDYCRTLRLPKSWRPVTIDENHPLYGMRAWRGPERQSVCLSVGRYDDDGRRWLHVSIARPNKMPSYADLARLKTIFIGPDAPASEHVNIHPHALHLWCCLDGDGLPNFGRYGTI